METNEFVSPSENNDEELLKLVISIQNGDQVETNLPLLTDKLKGLIKSIKNRKRNSSVISDDEAFGICMMSIYEVTKNYDSTKGSFTTYVYPYLQNALYSEIDKMSGVIAPDRIKRLTPKVLQIVDEYIQENDGEEPSNEEIQDILSNNDIEVSLDDIELCRNINSLQIGNIEDEECLINGSTTDVYQAKTIEEILDIAEVSEDEKRIYLFRKKEGMKLKEIADIEKVCVRNIYTKIENVEAKIWRKKKELGID